MSDCEEDSIDVQSFSNLSSANSLGGAYRAEAADQWTASNGINVKIQQSLTGQLRGLSMRSSSMIGLILQCLKQENEDQH